MVFRYGQNSNAILSPLSDSVLDGYSYEEAVYLV